MSFAYTHFKTLLAQASIDWDGGDDIRLCLVMTNTTADTEEDVTAMDGFTTLDEFDGSGYGAGFGGGRIALANEAVNEDTANDRAELDADDVTGLSYGDGTRDIAGMIVYQHGASEAASVPLLYINSGGYPIAGSNFVGVTFDTEGLCYIS